MKVHSLLVVFLSKEQVIRATRAILVQKASIVALLFPLVIFQSCSVASPRKPNYGNHVDWQSQHASRPSHWKAEYYLNDVEVRDGQKWCCGASSLCRGRAQCSFTVSTCMCAGQGFRAEQQLETISGKTIAFRSCDWQSTLFLAFHK